MVFRANLSRFHCFIVASAGLTCAAVLAIGLTVWWLRSEAIREAHRHAGSIATVLAEQTNHSVQSINLMFNDLQERIKSLGADTHNDFRLLLRGEDTYQLLTERMAQLSYVTVIALTDKNGWLVNSTNRWPVPPTDVSIRDHFQYFKNNDDRGVYISLPFVSRLNGIPTIFFNKRVNDANNEFVGIVSIGVRVSYFQHIYGSIKSLHDTSFLFLRKDGTVILRYPDHSDRIGVKLPEASPWYGLVAQGGGNYRSSGYFDGEARLVAVRPLGDYPLVINVAVSETEALATWRIQAITIGIGTLLLVLCSVFFLIVLSKQFRRLANSKAALIEKAEELERANTKADAALNNMSQGLVMFDSVGRLVVCNDRYRQLYNLPSDLAKPGCAVLDLLKYRVANGTFSGDPEKYVSDLLASISQGKMSKKAITAGHDSIALVTNQPMANGGWVATHEDVTEQRRSEQRIFHMAHYDTLTNLPNRATFNETMDATLEVAATTGEQFAVLNVDLDRLKEANDNYGHLVGDSLLREVARRLQTAARGAFLARIGGDEFTLIMADGPQPEGASALADRLLAAVTGDFEAEGQRLKLSLSIGVAVYPIDGTDAKTLMTNADAALYRAKAETRGAAMFFEPEMGARLRERNALREDLRSALDRGKLQLHYQPQMKMSGETIGFEALVRWQCPKRGMVSPGTFIPIAEESSLIIPVSEWVLREACREAASWPQPLTIAVNISPIQFRHGDLPRLVHSILLETGLAPTRLELEITESVMIHDFSRAVLILNRLKSLGVKIAMDDFGTGYSSLSYLHSFAFDKIKIDRIFICDLESNYHSRAIMRAVIGLGHSLNLPILAEGVETEAQHMLLVQEGCDEVQGYLTGRPLPIADYADLVGRQPAAQQNYAVAG
jgi:diguanylate cyclase (GGDEF)-like protein